MMVCQHMYQKEILCIIHQMEDNLKILLEEVHSNGIHLKDHHLIHLLIIWMANTWSMHVYAIVVSTNHCITCTRTNNQATI
jgi:hypothetical protein